MVHSFQGLQSAPWCPLTPFFLLYSEGCKCRTFLVVMLSGLLWVDDPWSSYSFFANTWNVVGLFFPTLGNASDHLKFFKHPQFRGDRVSSYMKASSIWAYFLARMGISMKSLWYVLFSNLLRSFFCRSFIKADMVTDQSKYELSR